VTVSRTGPAVAGYQRQPVSVHISVLTPTARSWLMSDGDAVVHHLFPNVCNLIDEGRAMVSLVLREAALGPSSMLVASPMGTNGELRFDERYSIDTPIVRSNGGLRIGDDLFSVDSARIWNPQVDWDHCHRDHVLPYMPLIESELRSAAPPGTLDKFTSEDPLTGESGVFLAAYRFYLNALRSNDLGKIAMSSRGLAGLGEGLTPSGDDFLLGSIFAMWLVDSAGLRKIIELIVSEATPRTTALSAAWLHAANAGEAGILWHWLFSSIVNDIEEDVIRFSRQIAETGHSSGADALSGFILTAKLLSRS